MAYLASLSFMDILTCAHFYTIVNNAARNILLQISWEMCTHGSAKCNR